MTEAPQALAPDTRDLLKLMGMTAQQEPSLFLHPRASDGYGPSRDVWPRQRVRLPRSVAALTPDAGLRVQLGDDVQLDVTESKPVFCYPDWRTVIEAHASHLSADERKALSGPTARTFAATLRPASSAATIANLAEPLGGLELTPVTLSVLRASAIKGTLRLLGWLATRTVAGLAIGVVTLTFLLLSILPRLGVYTTLTVLSGSMEPAIKTGSVVVALPVAPETVVVGDVITVTSAEPPYATVTHRVYEVSRDGEGVLFKTKGDANQLPDPWNFYYTGPAGKIVLAIPYLGYVLAYSNSPLVRVVIVLAVAGLFLRMLLPLLWRRGSSQLTGVPV